MRRRLLERLGALVQPRWDGSHRPPPRELAANLWSVERRFSLPGGARLPTLSFVVRGAGGGLVVLSPLPDDVARRDVARLGPVRALVAPNSFHYGGLASWHAAFPAAEVWLAPGLAARRPELPAGRELREDEPLPETSLAHAVLGPTRGVSEVAFLHRPSRTLLLTDVCFHVQGAERARDRLALRMLGAWRRFGPARTSRAILLRDRAEVARFVENLCGFDFARIAVAHGELLDPAGPETLRVAFRPWL